MSHYSPFGQTHGDWGKPIGLRFPRAIQHLLPPFDTIITFSLGMMGRRPPWSEFMEVVSDMFDYHRLSYSSWKLFWGVNPHAPTPIEELWLVCNSIFVFWLSFPCLKNIGLHGMNGGDTYSFICPAHELFTLISALERYSQRRCRVMSSGTDGRFRLSGAGIHTPYYRKYMLDDSRYTQKIDFCCLLNFPT